MHRCGPRLVILAAAAALSLPAQITTAAKTLEVFKVEYALTFDQNMLPSLPLDLGDAIADGSVEIRQQVQLDSPGKRLFVRTFTVPAGSASITELADAQQTLLEKYSIDITGIRSGARDFTFTGTIGKNPVIVVSPAVQEGMLVTLTASWYGSVMPVSVIDVLLTSGNMVVLYRPIGRGVFEYSGTPNRAPVIGIAPVPQTLFQPELRLDASATTDPDNDPLNYAWTSIARGASISNANTPTPRIQFDAGSGVYTFLLTVTDARGATSEATVSVSYYGR